MAVSNPLHFPFPFFYLRLEQRSGAALQIDPCVGVLNPTRIGRVALHQTPDCSRVFAFGKSLAPGVRDFLLEERLRLKGHQSVTKTITDFLSHGVLDHLSDSVTDRPAFDKTVESRYRIRIETVDGFGAADDFELVHVLGAPYDAIAANVIVEECRKAECRCPEMRWSHSSYGAP